MDSSVSTPPLRFFIPISEVSPFSIEGERGVGGERVFILHSSFFTPPQAILHSSFFTLILFSSPS